jgi:hypothetical protein
MFHKVMVRRFIFLCMRCPQTSIFNISLALSLLESVQHIHILYTFDTLQVGFMMCLMLGTCKLSAERLPSYFTLNIFYLQSSI